MPAPPLANNFDGGVNGAAIATADVGSGNPWTATQVVAGGVPAYDNAQRRGLLSMKVAEPAAGMGSIAVGWDGLGSLTSNVWARSYVYQPAMTASFYLILAQGYTNAVAPCASVGVNPSAGTGFPSCLVIFNAAGAVVGNGTVPLTTAQWLRLEWRVKASATVGELQMWAYDGTDHLVDSVSASGLVLGANLDRMDFGNVGSPEASYTHWMDDVAVSTSGPLGQSPPAQAQLLLPRSTSGPALR